MPTPLSNQDIELSVVVLAYRAEEYLTDFCHQLVQELHPLGIFYEIILVANYTDLADPTPQQAMSLATAYSAVRAVTRQKEGRMGWDMKSGLQVARGRYLVVIDGDGQMPVSDIPLVYGIIKANNFDMVKTYRAIRHDGQYRNVVSKVYNVLFNVLFNPPVYIRDVNSKPKIFSQQAYRQMQLTSNDWFTDAEIIIEALQHQMKICEVATVFYKNERRASYVRWSTIAEFTYNLLYYRIKTWWP